MKRLRWNYSNHGNSSRKISDVTFKTCIILKPAVDQLAALFQESANELKENRINGLNEEIKEDAKAALTNGHSEDIPMENGLDKSEPERVTRSSSKSKTPDSTSNGSSNNISKKKKNAKKIYSSAAEFMGIPELNQVEEFQDNPMLTEVQKMITDMISKIDLHALGELEFNENQTSETFLKALSNGEDLKPYMTENDLKVHCFEEEGILTAEEFKELENTEVNQLILAFIKVIHAIRQKFIKPPFTIIEKQKYTQTIIATRAFVVWQQAIIDCNSLSSLALFITLFDSAVQWISIKNSVKCPVCRKKTQAEDSVVCDNCLNQYHIQCTPVEVESRVGWLCKACSRKAAPPKKRKPPSRYYQEEEEEVYEDEEQQPPPSVENDEEEEAEEEQAVAAQSTSSINMDDVFQTSDSPPPNDDNNSSVENHKDGNGGSSSRNGRVRKNKRPVDYSEYGDSLLNN